MPVIVGQVRALLAGNTISGQLRAKSAEGGDFWFLGGLFFNPLYVIFFRLAKGSTITNDPNSAVFGTGATG